MALSGMRDKITGVHGKFCKGQSSVKGLRHQSCTPFYCDESASESCNKVPSVTYDYSDPEAEALKKQIIERLRQLKNREKKEVSPLSISSLYFLAFSY